MKIIIVALLALVAVQALPTINNNERTELLNRKAFPDEWKMAGFALPGDQLRFVLGLKQRNLDVLEKKFWDVSTPGNKDYQNFMTYQQILDIIAPPEAERKYVYNWLLSMGVEKDNIEDRGDNFGVTVPVSVASRIFQTEFFRFQHVQRKTIIVRQLGPYSLPKALWNNVITMIGGPSDFPAYYRLPHVQAGQEAVVPQVLEQQYNIPSTASASSTSQGVIEFGSGQYFSPSDLQTWAQKVAMTITPLTSKHIVNPSPPVGIEGTLDIQYISTTGVDSTNWYWTNADWLYEFATAFSAASDKPEIVSISYGWSELAQCEIDSSGCQQLGVQSEGYVKAVNTEFQKIGLQGVSLMCASGDSGANGRTDPSCTASKLRPTYPAASPYITAVGATQLVDPDTPLSNPPPVCTSGQWSCKSGGKETAVSFEQSQFTSGGGFSNFAPRPSYQDDAVNAYFNSGVQMPPDSMWNKTNRGFPDVASLGSAILIYAESLGGVAAVGGTSASSPSFAGYMSLVNHVVKQKSGKPLGFLNPFLYKMYSDQPSTFTDIVTGNNVCTESGCASSCKGFYCAKGWDGVTGLGVANVEEMIKYANSNF